MLAQVTSLDEARAAIAAGASGLIAKGCESGGRIGDETTFVLLQRLVDARRCRCGCRAASALHTAAACIAGGAAGVVLDSQLALVRESSLAAPMRAAIAAMDGSETAVVGGHRVFTRPDLPVARLAASTATCARGSAATTCARSCCRVGQDGAFAQPLAAALRAPSGGVVRGVRAAIDDHLALARGAARRSRRARRSPTRTACAIRSRRAR